MKIVECFIFDPGTWLGEGKVKLAVSEEELKYVTRWQVNKLKKNGQIGSVQEVQITGIPDVMQNQFASMTFAMKSLQFGLKIQLLEKSLGQESIDQN